MKTTSAFYTEVSFNSYSSVTALRLSIGFVSLLYFRGLKVPIVNRERLENESKASEVD